MCISSCSLSPTRAGSVPLRQAIQWLGVCRDGKAIPKSFGLGFMKSDLAGAGGLLPSALECSFIWNSVFLSNWAFESCLETRPSPRRRARVFEMQNQRWPRFQRQWMLCPSRVRSRDRDSPRLHRPTVGRHSQAPPTEQLLLSQNPGRVSKGSTRAKERSSKPWCVSFLKKETNFLAKENNWRSLEQHLPSSAQFSSVQLSSAPISSLFSRSLVQQSPSTGSMELWDAGEAVLGSERDL